MFGNTPAGLLLLDILLLVFGGVLIPLLYAIFKILRDILTYCISFGETMTTLCKTVKSITDEMTETRLRDVKFENQITNLQTELTRHIREDTSRGKK